ncbi:MAG: response regulator [Deltaproteobacteria bacterium]|nr:response regulator [Deltaproteobacteria bacterium]
MEPEERKTLDLPEYGLSALVLDDDQRVLSAARRSLGMAGFGRIVCVRTAQEAIGATRERRFDIVFIDVHLGHDSDCDGIECLRRIRASGYDGAISMLSGDSGNKAVIEAAKVLADDYLCKTEQDWGRAALRIIESVNGTLGGDAIYSREHLHSLGITGEYLDTLVEYADGFPSYKVLAERIGVSENCIATRLSRILKLMGLESSQQLAERLTSVKLLGGRPRKQE